MHREVNIAELSVAIVFVWARDASEHSALFGSLTKEKVGKNRD